MQLRSGPVRTETAEPHVVAPGTASIQGRRPGADDRRAGGLRCDGDK